VVEVAAEAALQALPRCGRRVARAGNPKSSRTAAELWTGSMIGPNGRGCASCARTFATRFQRLGPNAGGGAERGTYGCRSGGVVAVRPIGGNVLGAAGFWFGVSGSWSRMRHQRAAAGWSSGRDPTAAADRTRSVASKPARARLLNLPANSGRNGSAIARGAYLASSCRHRRSALVSGAASRWSSRSWKIRAM
jgi:hypothetical protein